MEIITRAEAKARGLGRYFTGKPCKHGHVAERVTANGSCWPCSAARAKSHRPGWAAKNKDKLNAYDRERRRQHPERHQAYYAKNADRIRERQRKRAAANPEKNRNRVKAWAAENPEAVKRTHRKWVLANPEKIAANDRKQRARRLGAEGSHTAAEILDLFKRQHGKCAYCRISLQNGYHADHVVPLAKGGSNWITNIQLTCPDCNFRKNRADPIDFARRLGKLL